MTNRELYLKQLREKDDNDMAMIFCKTHECAGCPARSACNNGGRAGVANWLKQESGEEE